MKQYCDTSKLSIRKISKSVAKDIIVKNHYSHLWTKVSYSLGLLLQYLTFSTASSIVENKIISSSSKYVSNSGNWNFEEVSITDKEKLKNLEQQKIENKIAETKDKKKFIKKKKYKKKFYKKTK